MRPRLRPLALSALSAFTALALAACGSAEEEPALPSGWVDVAGMVCADGSPTGVGVSPGTANRVLVFLAGGGACWSARACDAQLRSFGRADYGFASAFVGGTIFDRTLPANPFAGWTIVFVPYCTGDVHAGGDVTQSYGPHGFWRHHGRKNLQAALDYVKGILPAPEKLVVAGSSAGGFGALLALDLVRARWPAGGAGTAKVYLVDDSGQTFVGDDLDPALRDAWWASWNLDATVTPLCAGCKADLSALWTTLAAAHPGDRLALLSSTQDSTMRAFFGGMAPDAFQTRVSNLAARLADVPNAASFRVGGLEHQSDHALLLRPGAYSAGGRTLLGWLGMQLADDAAWTSVGP